MNRLLTDLQTFQSSDCEGTVDSETLQLVIAQATKLQQLPCSQKTLKNKVIAELYKGICGYVIKREERINRVQNFDFVSYIACASLTTKVEALFKSYAGMQIVSCPYLTWLLGAFPPLCVLPSSASDFLRLLQASAGSRTVPFSDHLPTTNVFGGPAWYSIRMLACLEMDNCEFTSLPSLHAHSELIDKILQRRAEFAQVAANANGIATTVDDIQCVLQQFYDDPYSLFAKRSWLSVALDIPKARIDDPDYIAEVFAASCGTLAGLWMNRQFLSLRCRRIPSRRALCIIACFVVHSASAHS